MVVFGRHRAETAESCRRRRLVFAVLQLSNCSICSLQKEQENGVDDEPLRRSSGMRLIALWPLLTSSPPCSVQVLEVLGDWTMMATT